jgi:DNA-binding CsgD family transcriptional regulator
MGHSPPNHASSQARSDAGRTDNIPPFRPNDEVWRALCHDAGFAVTVCDREGNIVYANEHSLRFFRWQQAVRLGRDPTREHTDRRTMRDAAPHAAIEERLAFIARVCDTGRSLAYESLVQGIRLFITMRPVADDEGRRLVMITSRRMNAWERAEDLTDGSTELVEPETHDPGILATLSPRELDVLILLGEGLPHADIAERLGLSIRTVERHRDRLGQKLRATNRVDLARFAFRAGLAGLPDPAAAYFLKDNPRDPLDLSKPLRRHARRRVRLHDVLN